MLINPIRKSLSRLAVCLVVIVSSAITVFSPILTRSVAAATVPEACYVFDSASGTITDYDPSANPSCLKNIDIPNSIGGTAVTIIGANAFYGKQLTAVTIPSSVTTIGNNSFEENQLTTITIPDAVTSMGAWALSYNQLTSVSLPNSLTAISNGLLSNNSLTSLTIPDTVTSIGEEGLMNNSLSAINIPSGVTSIGTQALSYNQLTSLVIPDSVTNLGYSVFDGNPLEEITFGSSNYHGAPHLALTNGLMTGMTSLTKVTIGNSVSLISNSAFGNCSISQLDLGQGVQTINNGAFMNNQITSLTVPDSVTDLSYGAFDGNPLESLTIGTPNFTGTPTLVIGSGAIDNTYLTSLTIGNSVLSITDGAFANGILTSLSLSDSVQTIGDYAFAANSLTSVVIPASVTSIGSYAFDESPLQTVILKGNTTIDPTAFVGVNPLTGQYLRIYTSDPTNPFNITDQPDNTDGGAYIVNPAAIAVNYNNAQGSSLSGSVFKTGDNLSDYSIAANPTADFSMYYRAGQHMTLVASAISGYATPAAKTITLAPNTNTVSFIYYTPAELAALTPGAPNTGVRIPLTNPVSQLFIGVIIILAALLLVIRYRLSHSNSAKLN